MKALINKDKSEKKMMVFYLSLLSIFLWVLAEDSFDTWFKQMQTEMDEFDKQFDEMQFSTPFLDGSSYQDCGYYAEKNGSNIDLFQLSNRKIETELRKNSTWKLSGQVPINKVYPDFYIAFAEMLVQDPVSTCPKPQARRILVAIPKEFSDMGLTELYLGMMPGGSDALQKYNDKKISKYDLAATMMAGIKAFPMAEGICKCTQKIVDLVATLKTDQDANGPLYVDGSRGPGGSASGSVPATTSGSVPATTSGSVPASSTSGSAVTNSSSSSKPTKDLSNSMDYINNKTIMWAASKRNAQLLLKFSKLDLDEAVTNKSNKLIKAKNLAKLDPLYGYIINMAFRNSQNKNCNFNYLYTPKKMTIEPITNMSAYFNGTNTSCLNGSKMVNLTVIVNMDITVSQLKVELGTLTLFETEDACYRSKGWKLTFVSEKSTIPTKFSYSWKFKLPPSIGQDLPLYLKASIVKGDNTYVGFKRFTLLKSQNVTDPPVVSWNKDSTSEILQSRLDELMMLRLHYYTPDGQNSIANNILLKQALYLCDVSKSLVVQTYRIKLAIKDVFQELALETTDYTKVQQCPSSGDCAKSDMCKLYDVTNDFYCDCGNTTIGLGCEFNSKSFNLTQSHVAKVLKNIATVQNDAGIAIQQFSQLIYSGVVLNEGNLEAAEKLLTETLIGQKISPNKPEQVAQLLNAIIQYKNVTKSQHISNQ